MKQARFRLLVAITGGANVDFVVQRPATSYLARDTTRVPAVTADQQHSAHHRQKPSIAAKLTALSSILCNRPSGMCDYAEYSLKRALMANDSIPCSDNDNI